MGDAGSGASLGQAGSQPGGAPSTCSDSGGALRPARSVCSAPGGEASSSPAGRAHGHAFCRWAHGLQRGLCRPSPKAAGHGVRGGCGVSAGRADRAGGGGRERVGVPGPAAPHVPPGLTPGQLWEAVKDGNDHPGNARAERGCWLLSRAECPGAQLRILTQHLSKGHRKGCARCSDPRFSEQEIEPPRKHGLQVGLELGSDRGAISLPSVPLSCGGDTRHHLPRKAHEEPAGLRAEFSGGHSSASAPPGIPGWPCHPQSLSVLTCDAGTITPSCGSGLSKS